LRYYENQTSNAWTLRVNGSKALIKIEAQEIWMEQDFEIGLTHIF